MAKDYKKDVGEAIRKYRLSAGMSQMALAEKIGISYQQLQKYEKGTNSISLYRLKQICESLKIPVSYILEDLEPEKTAEEISEYGLSKQERAVLDLFRRIDTEDIRRGLLLQLKGIVKILKKNSVSP